MILFQNPQTDYPFYLKRIVKQTCVVVTVDLIQYKGEQQPDARSTDVIWANYIHTNYSLAIIRSPTTILKG